MEIDNKIIAGLNNLQSNKIRNSIGFQVVKTYFNDIMAAINNGVKQEDIAKYFVEQFELDIKPKTFLTYVYRYSKNKKNSSYKKLDKNNNNNNNNKNTENEYSNNMSNFKNISFEERMNSLKSKNSPIKKIGEK